MYFLTIVLQGAGEGTLRGLVAALVGWVVCGRTQERLPGKGPRPLPLAFLQEVVTLNVVADDGGELLHLQSGGWLR